MKSKRVKQRRDELGRAFAGSQLQVQLYVNRRRLELDRAISRNLDLPTISLIEWRSPLEPGFAEYMDGRFLDALDLRQLRDQLKQFWPRSGPRWDGLAIVRDRKTSSPSGYLLVEGKSYPAEIFGNGCGAPEKSPNRVQIDESLKLTASALSIYPGAAWTGRLYQFANRLAHVHFLSSSTKLPVWLVNLCFIDDPCSPTSQTQWDSALVDIKKDLGFHNRPVPHSLDLFLPARPRGELLSPPVKDTWAP